MANLYIGAPLRLFEQPEDPEVISAAGIVEGGEGSGAAGEFVVCDGGERSPSEERAERMVREAGVDITASEMEIESGVIESRLRNILQDTYPSTFGGWSSMSDAAFLDELGITSDGVRSAARRITTEAAVLGRVITADPDAPGRVVGTSSTARTVDPAFVFASTAGEAATDHGDSAAHRPSTDYGVAGEQPDFTDYSLGSVFAGLDAIASAFGSAASRVDTREFAAGLDYDTTQPILAGARESLRSLVPHRVQACIGQPITVGSETGVDRVRIRLYGTGPLTEPYELWWGEAGLQCAVRGNIEGIPCDPAQLRVNPTIATVGTAPDAGFGSKYVEWDFDSNDVPILASAGCAGPRYSRVVVPRSARGS